ncbi:MAG TPA: MFS transporter [Armatimonadota bacterium]|nr:MFS transporter [Armatimonadota bacterium]
MCSDTRPVDPDGLLLRPDMDGARETLVSPGRLSTRQLLAISAYWLGTNLHWMALLMVIMPAQIEQIAPQSKSAANGVILGVGALLAAIVPAFAGALSDRCMSRWGRRRPYLAAGVAVNIVGLLALWYAGFERSLPLYLLGYLVIQLGNGTAGGAYSGVIPDIVPESQYGEASGYTAAFSQIGNIIGGFGAGYLMGRGYVAASFAAIGITLALSLIVTLMGTHERPLRAAPPPFSFSKLLKSFWIDPREHPDFAWVWITRALVTLGIWTIQPQIQYYLEDVVGVKNPQLMSGMLLGVILIGATITGLIGGLVSDRVGRKRVVYIANTMIAITMVAFCFGHSLLYTFLVGMFFGLGLGAYYSVDWALGCAVLPDREHNAAKDMGVWHISMTLPQSIAPALAGLVLTLLPHHLSPGPSGPIVHYSVIGYDALFLITAVFLLLGAVLIRNVRSVQ